MLINPTYGASGGSPSTIPQLVFGVSAGEPYGSPARSISITTTGHVGEKAIFVVLHREELTVDESWELIDTKSQEWSISGGSGTQYISIYQKIIEADTETYTITTEDSTRKCCYCYYAPANISLEYERTVSVTKELLYNVYYAFWYVSNVNQPYFVVVNTPYNISGEFDVKINSQYPDEWDRPRSGFPDARLVCVPITSDVTIATYPYSNSSSTMEQVGVYLYKIGNN